MPPEKPTHIRPRMSQKEKEESLIREMFSGVEISEMEMRQNRKILKPFLNAYFDLDCDDDEG